MTTLTTKATMLDKSEPTMDIFEAPDVNTVLESSADIEANKVTILDISEDKDNYEVPDVPVKAKTNLKADKETDMTVINQESK